MTKMAEIWRWLKRAGKPMSPRAVAEGTGVTQDHAGTALRRLVAAGYASGSGATWSRTYVALGRTPPPDMRGRHSEVAINFAKGRVIANAARAAERGRLYVPKAKHPLDKVMRRAR